MASWKAANSFTLAQLKAMKSRTQITRHDCVEGWMRSASGRRAVERAASSVHPSAGPLTPCFHCADPMAEGGEDFSNTRASTWKMPIHRRRSLAYHSTAKHCRFQRRAPAPARRTPARLQNGQVPMRIELVDSFARIAGRPWAATGRTTGISGMRDLRFTALSFRAEGEESRSTTDRDVSLSLDIDTRRGRLPTRCSYARHYLFRPGLEVHRSDMRSARNIGTRPADIGCASDSSSSSQPFASSAWAGFASPSTGLRSATNRRTAGCRLRES